jgi:hypothetical protein
MAKSLRAYKLSTSIAAMLLGVAAAQNALAQSASTAAAATTTAVDPGVRAGTAGAGDPVPGLTFLRSL